MSDVILIDANELKRDFAELCATECPICSFYIPNASVSDCHCGLIDRATTIAKCGKTSDGFPFMDLRPKPTGEWIFDSDNIMFGNPYGSYKCTNCSSWTGWVTNFCPNCGAKMKEGGRK